MLDLPLGLNLRIAAEADTPFLAQLYRTTRQDLQQINQSEEFLVAFINMQFNAQKTGYSQQFPNAIYWVVELHDLAIGKVTLDFTSDLVHLIDFAIDPKFQNKGYGQAVVQSLQMAAQKVAAPLLISVAKDNYLAVKLYKQLGFTFDASSPSAMYQRMIWYPESIKQYSFS